MIKIITLQQDRSKIALCINIMVFSLTPIQNPPLLIVRFIVLSSFPNISRLLIAGFLAIHEFIQASNPPLQLFAVSILVPAVRS